MSVVEGFVDGTRWVTVPLPPGYYAIHILYEDCDADDPRFCEVVGWHLVSVSKTGRVRTRAVSQPGLDDTRLFFDALASEREHFGDGHHLTLGEFVDVGEPEPSPQDVLDNHKDLLDVYRAGYAKFTGRCAACNRKLTDPDSIIRGIGPECARAGL